MPMIKQNKFNEPVKITPPGNSRIYLLQNAGWKTSLSLSICSFSGRFFGAGEKITCSNPPMMSDFIKTMIQVKCRPMDNGKGVEFLKGFACL